MIGIADSIFNRIMSRYTGGEGVRTNYTPAMQANYPAPGTQLSYPTPGTAIPSWRMNAAGTASAPVAEGPSLLSRIATSLTSGIGLLNRPGAPTGAAPTGVTPSAGGWPIDANGNLIGAPQARTSAATVGRTPGLLPVSNYGQIAKGLPAFAMENRAEILKRNII